MKKDLNIGPINVENGTSNFRFFEFLKKNYK